MADRASLPATMPFAVERSPAWSMSTESVQRFRDNVAPKQGTRTDRVERKSCTMLQTQKTRLESRVFPSLTKVRSD
jgi:hypothetical protein